MMLEEANMFVALDYSTCRWLEGLLRSFEAPLKEHMLLKESFYKVNAPCKRGEVFLLQH